MHFHFPLTAAAALWTLTFAALLVLLVVLLGRDRARRFPWFTASIVLTALRLLTSRLLFGRMAPITLSAIAVMLIDVTAVVSVLVVVEMARQGFDSASRRAWNVSAVVMVAVSLGIVIAWGPWPAWKTISEVSVLGALRFMQLVAQKGNLLADLLVFELGIMMALFGRRYKAGWRSHTQRLVIGLSVAALSQIAVEVLWREITMHARPRNLTDYQHIMGLQEKLFSANSTVYLAVLVWWIACLWKDEPGAPANGETIAELPPAAAGPSAPAQGN
ncbi:MAG: hypothetical protein ACLGRW_04265 [Acidobacteriota bacterium]|jgi:hypothetical protein